MSLYITLNWPCDFAFNEYIHGVLAYFLSLRLILCLSVLCVLLKECSWSRLYEEIPDGLSSLSQIPDSIAMVTAKA